MESTIHKIFRAITERVAAIVGASIGTAASTYRTICEAEQQSLLEDIAQQYESDGKQALADNLRKQAARIQSSDPAAEAVIITQQLLLGGETASPADTKPACDSVPKLSDSKSNRRGRSIRQTKAAGADDLEDLA